MYTVFGYDDMCVDFSCEFDSFVKAVKFIKAHRDCMCFLRREAINTCMHGWRLC